MSICIICGKEYNTKNKTCSRSCATALGNKNKKGKYKYSKERVKKISNKHTLKRIKVIKICEKCGKDFEVERTISKEGKENILKKERRFCSQKCSNSHTQTEEINEARRQKLKNRKIPNRKPAKRRLKKKIIKKKIIKKKISKFKGNKKYCKDCNKEINKNNKTGFCIKCLKNFRESNRETYNLYKLDCAFNFNVYDYSEEFNLELLEQYGWYSPSNRNNNLEGVSRDHIYSIKAGYTNNINPEIISHPANCKLMLHKYNNSKNTKCGFSLEELNNKIKDWENKY